MLLSVWHSTVYRYETEVARSTQYIRLSPAQSVRQRIVDWRVELPVPAVTMTDAFDNLTHVLTLDAPHQEIRLLARGRVEVDESDDGEPAGRINPRVFLRATPLTEPDEAIRAFVAPQRGLVRSRPMMGVTDLMHALIERMPYEKGHTSVESTAAQSFAAGRGACQDHAHPFVACRPAPGAPRPRPSMANLPPPPPPRAPRPPRSRPRSAPAARAGRRAAPGSSTCSPRVRSGRCRRG